MISMQHLLIKTGKHISSKETNTGGITEEHWMENILKKLAMASVEYPMILVFSFLNFVI